MKLEKRIDQTIVQYLLDSSNLIRKNGALIASQVDLTTQQWLILLLLGDDPNNFFVNEKKGNKMTASEVAEYIGVSRPNMTNLLNNLLDKKLIEQTHDKFDKRKKVLVLTEKARGLLSTIEPLRIDSTQNMLADFTEEEKEIFLSYLKRCLTFLIDAK